MEGGTYAIDKNRPKESFWAVICRRSVWETNIHYHLSQHLPAKNRPR